MISIDERNRLIDGWRGVSVALVIIGHLVHYRLNLARSVVPVHAVAHDPVLLAQNLMLRLISPLGSMGVSFFFVISGFLITTLLVQEEARRGSVKISAFYARRVFRILPAFSVYLLSIFLLRAHGLVFVENDAFVRTGLFVCNVSGFGCSWWLAHTWSLSVEEQFYLCWPLIFVLMGHARVSGISYVIVGLVVGSLIVPELSPFVYIAVGVLFAVSSYVREWVGKRCTTPVILIAGSILVLQPLAFPIPLLEKAITIINPALVAAMFFGTLIGRRGGPVFAIVSNKFVARIGLFSYSLYLWQQLSLAPMDWNGQVTGAHELYRHLSAIWMVAFIPVSIVSYYLVERPCVRIGRSISNRLSAMPVPSKPSEQRTQDAIR